MRLLNVQTLTLEEFDQPPLPPYAILSHTWGEEEITFQDINNLQKASVKAGFTKFKLTCRMTAAEQLKYVWIDTCCIDKSSGAELSEAINSMYQWYRSSSKCLVYLEDLPSSITAGGPDGLLENCRWFKRGWTLQELVAPRTVVFYNQVWDFIGEKKSTALLSRISSATGIHQDILLNPDLIYTTSLAVRMSWAADRATSRKEDVAYCLLGLFKVNMPLLYGEGDRAFHRLQEEIIRTSNDLSIFAWYDEDNICGYHGMLADSPRRTGSQLIVPFAQLHSRTFGLGITIFGGGLA
ncbi:heterokaryon incompatibility protein-domain-containing protein [Xylaria cubensis]|nr:heterokaryon incompatibility protein-domain-containing protein [Xylaria cubensis]